MQDESLDDSFVQSRHFYHGSRKSAIRHAQLRMKCSKLSFHLRIKSGEPGIPVFFCVTKAWWSHLQAQRHSLRAC